MPSHWGLGLQYTDLTETQVSPLTSEVSFVSQKDPLCHRCFLSDTVLPPSTDTVYST